LLVWFSIWIHLITKMYTLMYQCIYDIMRQSLPDTIRVFRCVVYCRFCMILLYRFNLCCFKAFRRIKCWCKLAICNLWNSASQFFIFVKSFHILKLTIYWSRKAEFKHYITNCTVKSIVVWVVTLCTLEKAWHFLETYQLHLQS
jgi:hypothetical protein